MNDLIFKYINKTMVNQIKYIYEVRNKGRLVKKLLIRIDKKIGLYAEYEERNPNKMDEIKGPAVFYLKNADFNKLPVDKLFEEFNKIFFPKVTNFFDKRMMGKPTWYITVDKVEYFGNSEPEFYQKVVSLLKKKEIEKHINKRINF